MTKTEMLGRRSEILKRTIGSLIVKDNQQGLDHQESHFLRNMVKELHQNEHELLASRSGS
ncbi:hypothetical protein MJA45_25685 [Paenibacillus aurantius]|uniref:Uncharacterized protein n=1 Tax=Paenibacillus aurantius TaxID=2918900 RepID=A0AA96LDB9_9BACL|nr:hypothetical protein [Paenibacillus aurantius]WJH35675.1 hypothetical protein N6H14_06770 [Paenibacillus sp. CC-CFT747]WNQ10968.1 hypothetical protein MJA45_25685 [Paenibacillus aurantius]